VITPSLPASRALVCALGIFGALTCAPVVRAQGEPEQTAPAEEEAKDPGSEAPEYEQAFRVPDNLSDFTVEEGEDAEELSLPRIRLELWFRGGGLGGTGFKKGPHYNAGRFTLHEDARVPRMPIFGLRAVAEVRFHEDWAVGLHATGSALEGPKRRLHWRGIRLQGRHLRSMRMRTKVEIAFAQAFVRMVFRDDSRIRLAFGAGLAWTSIRIRVRNRVQRADGRIQAYLAPTIGYMFTFRLWEHCHIWIESTNALIAPLRFPSYATEARAGLRFPFGPNFELGLGVGLSSAQLEDIRELWGGQEPPDTYRWRRTHYTLVTLEVGVSVRF
jgi:hypothetical protein